MFATTVYYRHKINFELVHVVVVLFFTFWRPATANSGQQTATSTTENFKF